MLLRPAYFQFTSKTEFEPFSTTSWLKKQQKFISHFFFFTNLLLLWPYKNLALQTWFHSFFLVGGLVLAEFFDLKFTIFRFFSKFKILQILPKTSILWSCGLLILSLRQERNLSLFRLHAGRKNNKNYFYTFFFKYPQFLWSKIKR